MNEEIQSNAEEQSGRALQNYNVFRLRKNAESFCYAPSNALYFAHGGKILACCFNRMHILGSYPQDDPVAVWKNYPVKELRQKLAIPDLSSGCHFCREQLNSGNFAGVGAAYYDHFPVYADAPSVLHFEISNRCNLNCIMCLGQNSAPVMRSRMARDPLADVYDDHFAERIRIFYPGLAEARFFGGEPFLIPLYDKIWNDLSDENPGCNISVQTNGTVFDNRIRKLLDKGRFHIGVSVDSVREDTFAAIRRNARLSEVMNNFMVFRDYCLEKGTFIGVAVCPQKQNWKEIPEILNYFGDLNVPVHLNVVWVPLSQALWTLGAQELDRMILFYEGARLPSGNAVRESNRKVWDGYLSLLLHWRAMAAERYSPVVSEKNDLLSYISGRLSSVLGKEEDAYAGILGKKMEALKQFLPGFSHDALLLRWLAAFPADVLAASLLAYDDLSFAEIAADLMIHPEPEKLSDV